MKTNATSNPRALLPGDEPGIGPNPSPERSFVNELQETVDELRQIATDLGVRPYRVFSVLIEWDGGAVGRGVARCVKEVEILPTPKVNETSGVQGEIRSAGLVERGSVTLSQVSGSYTEDQVRSMFMLAPLGPTAPGDGLKPGQETFIEVRVDARDGVTERRRFVVRGMPYRKAEAFEWRVSLMRQDMERARNGQPGGISGRLGR